MSKEPNQRRPPDRNWRPSIPNPALFQLPKPCSKPVTIRPPPRSNQSLAIQELDKTGSVITLSTSQKNFQEHKVPETLQRQPRDFEPATVPRVPKSSGTSGPTPNADTMASIGAVRVPEPPMTTPNQQSVMPSRTWRPDVFVQAFIPQSFLAVNNAPAKTIISESVEGINFSRYVSSFASPLFLPPLFVPNESPSIYHSPLLSTGDLATENYRPHFIGCIMLDLEAQTPEVRSYDLFGVQLHVIDHAHEIYSLHVPGLRESAPRVAYGDVVMLRQLILDPSTNLPQGMDSWVGGGSRERALPAPGFTGYEIIATVVAVDKRSEQLHLRAGGVTVFIPLVFNVSFVVQGRRVYCLQHTIADIANELALNSTHVMIKSRSSNPSISPLISSFASRTSPIKSIRAKGSTNSLIFDADDMKPFVDPVNHDSGWLRRMLFPQHSNGILLNGLPSGKFRQIWYDDNLNYEQMKAVDAIQSRNYGNIPYLINGPPGTGKTKTVVETVTQLAYDSNFIGTILVCAPSDPAADTLALRLKARFDPESILRLNEFSRTFAEVPQELMSYCYVEDNIFNLPALPVLMSYRIIVTTCRGAEVLIQARVTNRDLVSLQKNVTGILQSASESQKSTPLHWTALFVDEAAQATEPEVLIPLAVVTPHASRTCHPDPIFVMAGDQHQLGPRTYDKTTLLRVSLFKRLSDSAVYASHPQARRTILHRSPHLPMIRPPFVDLIRNYRSHPAILAVPSSLFYHNTLIPEAITTGALAAWPGWLGRRWPVLFACNNGIDDCEDVRTVGGAGWYNTREAHKAIHCAADILRTAVTPLLQSEICIMSPFRAQVNLLRNLARASSLWDLNIGPMEAFQGLESRVVILCTTRARTRFLTEDALRGVGVVNEPKKFNVAITRAMEGLIVFGNPWVLHRDPCWEAFLRFCWRNGLWRSDEAGRDPRMPEGEEADASRWEPANKGEMSNEIEGLEAALVYKDTEPTTVSKAARRFMGTTRDDEMWMSGVEAMEALRLKDGMEDAWGLDDGGLSGEAGVVS